MIIRRGHRTRPEIGTASSLVVSRSITLHLEETHAVPIVVADLCMYTYLPMLNDFTGLTDGRLAQYDTGRPRLPRPFVLHFQSPTESNP